MNWFVFIFYHFWILFSIFAILFIKFCVNDRWDNKPIKLPGWLYICLFVAMFIPIVNIIGSIAYLCCYIDDGKIKPGVVKWWNSLWIVKILVKEY